MDRPIALVVRIDQRLPSYASAEPRTREGCGRIDPQDLGAIRKLIAADLIEKQGAAVRSTERTDATFDTLRRGFPPPTALLDR